MNYELLERKFEEAKMFFQPENEKTIFSVGGKGFYENPITDLLAFFLDPQESHGFGTLFLDSLFNSLKLSELPVSIDLVTSPKREVSTENNKRIDLLLEGDDWLLIIENKIYRSQKNPFLEYENFIRNNYKKEPIFVILSPSGLSNSKEWIPLSYKSFIKELKANIGTTLVDSEYSKWITYLRDFILNLEQYAMRRNMDAKAINFIENNYQDLQKLIDFKKSYINHVQKIGMATLESLFPKQKFSTTIHNWGHGPAIRFYSDSWVGKSNIVIQISHRESDKGIGTYIYAYNVVELAIQDVDNQLLQEYHQKPWVESSTIRCYKSDNRYNSYQEALGEFEETAKVFNLYNRTVFEK